jgi:beta-alanine degradation protein BauB
MKEGVLPHGGAFDTTQYADELAKASDNHDIGTALWFENDHIRVFELRLEPGERAPFHIHDKTYFWTVVDAGVGLQRSADGSWSRIDYEVGDTAYRVQTVDEPLVHDLENVGDTTLRFVTVEFKR